MDILQVRAALRTQSIYDIPLRVTFYARVSSDSDEQLHSLDNQVTYYEELIRKNAAWTYVPGYIDEGLSGISTKKRRRFNEMIRDAENDRFDLIITKEISRFARNTLDSLQYTRELLRFGVGVFFQNDNINTLDEDSELRLTIMSSIAQDELRKLSSRVKFGHQQAIRSDVVLGNSRIFGYVKQDKHLAIDDTEAPMVQEIFRLYAGGNYSLKQLENHLYNEGFRNTNGRRITHSTLSGILSNPKYKGYYVGNKVRVVDMFTKKQKFLPPDEWIMHKDESGRIVPALVSEELWDKANEILEKRSQDVKHRQGVCNHQNLLTGKLFCAHCGCPYYRREARDRQGNAHSKWVCSGKINRGAASCPSFPLYENELIPLLFDALEAASADTDALIAAYETMFRALRADEGRQRRLDEAQKALALADRKRNTLIELLATGTITKERFKALHDTCERESEEAESIIRTCREEIPSDEVFARRMSEIRTRLAAAVREARVDMITPALVERTIDRITVTPIGPGEAKLEIQLSTGRKCETFLHHLRSSPSAGRTGVMLKKMIQSYETGMQAK